MQLRQLVSVHSDILSPTYREFWDKNALQKHLSDLFRCAYMNSAGSPEIKLSTRLIGEINGHKIKSAESENCLRLYIAESYTMQYGKIRVTNARNGATYLMSPNRIIVNSKGYQVYPPLSGRQKSALDKFIKSAYQTIYCTQKTK